MVEIEGVRFGPSPARAPCMDERRSTILRLAGEEEIVRRSLNRELRRAAAALRPWRLSRGATQRQLAQAMRISQPRLSQLESGARQLTVNAFMRYYEAVEAIAVNGGGDG